MHHRGGLISACVALCCATAGTAWAQCTLGGFVYDPRGDEVEGAAVVVTHEATGATVTRTTNISGVFYVRNLPPGRYRTTVVMPPYKPASAHITLEIGERKWQFFDLQIASVEELTVPGDSPPALLQRDGSLGATFSRDQIEGQPLTNARTMQPFEAAVPGIVVTESTGSLAQFTAVGQRRFSNRLTIDGVGADLGINARGEGVGVAGSGALPAVATTGGTQTLVPLAAIEEIQVRTTNAASEHARTPGAQTSVVTRAGAERFTGGALLDLRIPQLGASDWFSNSRGEAARRIKQWTGGASAGGPILPGRVFSFITWEGQGIDRSLAQILRVPSVASRAGASASARAVLSAFPEATGRELGGGLAESSQSIPIKSHLSTLSVRLDGHLSTRHRGFARVNLGGSEGDALNGERTPFLSFANNERTSTRSVTVGWTTLFASSTHDLRMNVTTHRGSLTASPASYGSAQPFPLHLLVPTGSDDNIGVRLNVFPGPGGVLLTGRTGASSQQQLQIVDTWTLSRGEHEWRVGADFHGVLTSTNPATDRYTYQFDTISNLLQGRVRFINIAHIEPARARLDSYSVFAQDTWRAAPRFTVSYGLRYSINPAPRSTTGVQPLLFEYELLPAAFRSRPTGASLWRTSFGNLAPRIAVVYQVNTRSGRETTFRAGFSRVYDELTRPGAEVFGRGYPYVSATEIRPSRFPVPPEEWTFAAPQSFASVPFAEAYAFPGRLRTPRIHEWHLGVDRTFGAGQRLSVAYVGNTGRHLIYPHTFYLDANHPIRAFSNDATSEYHALLVEHARRSSHGLESRITYAWGHAIDLDSGEGFDPNPPPALALPLSNRANADFDRRHVLRTTASYHIPAIRGPRLLRQALRDWQVGVVGVVASGAPVSVTFAHDFGGGAFYIVRPDVVPDIPVWVNDAASPTGRRINAAAFRRQTDARQGTAGRNALRATPLREIDVALSRRLRFANRVTTQIRLEAFNVFNIPNFSVPRADLGRPPVQFGVPFYTYAEGLGTGTLTTGGIVPTQQNGGPRAMQLVLRLGW